MTDLNDLLNEDLDTEAVELLVERINEVGQILRQVEDFANNMSEDDPEALYFQGYLQALSDFGKFLITGEKPA
jgi:hypothetical protein